MPSNCFLLMSSLANIRKIIKEADVVVGAVLIPGARTPKLVTQEMLKSMKEEFGPCRCGYRSRRLL